MIIKEAFELFGLKLDSDLAVANNAIKKKLRTLHPDKVEKDEEMKGAVPAKEMLHTLLSKFSTFNPNPTMSQVELNIQPKNKFIVALKDAVGTNKSGIEEQIPYIQAIFRYQITQDENFLIELRDALSSPSEKTSARAPILLGIVKEIEEEVRAKVELAKEKKIEISNPPPLQEDHKTYTVVSKQASDLTNEDEKKVQPLTQEETKKTVGEVKDEKIVIVQPEKTEQQQAVKPLADSPHSEEKSNSKNTVQKNYVVDLYKIAKEKAMSLEKTEEKNYYTPLKIIDVATLKERISLLEQEKYPTPPYTCKKFSATHEGHDRSITYITYSGVPPTAIESAKMNANALLVRELSLIAGVLNGLQYSGYITEDPTKKEAIKTKLLELSNQAIELVNNYQNSLKNGSKKAPLIKIQKRLSDFIGKAATEISIIANIHKDKAVDAIYKAEKYFVADLNSNNILINETSMKNQQNISQTYVQMDVPFNKLTQEQKSEFEKIHGPDSKQPLWFKAMEPWEQKWLKSKVPSTSTNDKDWTKFENIFQSSAMQNIPGIKNARKNYLFSEEKDEYTFLTKNARTASYVPYEIQPALLNKKETEQITEQAIATLKPDVTEQFNLLWGSVFSDKATSPKPIIFIHSLLSNTHLGTGDTKLFETQQRAVQEIKEEGVTIMFGNDPINIGRYLSPSDWQHVDNLLQYAKDFIQHLDKNEGTLNPIQLKNKAIIKEAITELNKLKETTAILGRNKTAFKSAYIEVLVGAMGGITTTNCKSGKDRTGLDELYQAAMLIYYEQNGKLPGYNDGPDDRKKFIDIYVTLFNSMKTQESASKNTPGSLGLKDSAIVLCNDIAKALGDNYERSNKRAALNKIGDLGKAEKREKTRLEEEYKKLNREQREQLGGSIAKDIQKYVKKYHSLKTDNKPDEQKLEELQDSIIKNFLELDSPSLPSAITQELLMSWVEILIKKTDNEIDNAKYVSNLTKIASLMSDPFLERLVLGKGQLNYEEKKESLAKEGENFVTSLMLSGYPQYNRAHMLQPTDPDPTIINPNTILMRKNEKLVTVYWMENQQIKKKTLEASNIKETLPEPGNFSTENFLLSEIIKHCGCAQREYDAEKLITRPVFKDIQRESSIVRFKIYGYLERLSKLRPKEIDRQEHEKLSTIHTQAGEALKNKWEAVRHFFDAFLSGEENIKENIRRIVYAELRKKVLEEKSNLPPPLAALLKEHQTFEEFTTKGSQEKSTDYADLSKRIASMAERYLTIGVEVDVKITPETSDIIEVDAKITPKTGEIIKLGDNKNIITNKTAGKDKDTYFNLIQAVGLLFKIPTTIPEFITREDLLKFFLYDTDRLIRLDFEKNISLLQKLGDLDDFIHLLKSQKKKLENIGITVPDSINLVIDKLEKIAKPLMLEQQNEEYKKYTKDIASWEAKRSFVEHVNKISGNLEEKLAYDTQLDNFFSLLNKKKFGSKNKLERLPIDTPEYETLIKYFVKINEAGTRSTTPDQLIEVLNSYDQELLATFKNFKQAEKILKEKKSSKNYTLSASEEADYKKIQQALKEIMTLHERISASTKKYNAHKNIIDPNKAKVVSKKLQKTPPNNKGKKIPEDPSRKGMVLYLIIMTEKSISEKKPTREYLDKLYSDQELSIYLDGNMPERRQLKKQIQALEKELVKETVQQLRFTSQQAVATTHRRYFIIDPNTHKPLMKLTDDNPVPYKTYSDKLCYKIQDEIVSCKDPFVRAKLIEHWIHVMEEAHKNKDQFTAGIVKDALISTPVNRLFLGEKAGTPISKEAENTFIQLRDLFNKGDGKANGYIEEMEQFIKNNEYDFVPHPSIASIHLVDMEAVTDKGGTPGESLQKPIDMFLAAHDHMQNHAAIDSQLANEIEKYSVHDKAKLENELLDKSSSLQKAGYKPGITVVAPSGLIETSQREEKKLSKEEEIKDRIGKSVEEFYAVQKKFQNDMATLMPRFSLVAMEKATAEEKSHINTLIQHFSADFTLCAIPTFNEKPRKGDKIEDHIFNITQVVEAFESPAFAETLAAHEKAILGNRWVSNFITEEEIAENQIGYQSTLSSEVVKPVQNIPRYVLKIKDLIKQVNSLIKLYTKEPSLSSPETLTDLKKLKERLTAQLGKLDDERIAFEKTVDSGGMIYREIAYSLITCTTKENKKEIDNAANLLREIPLIKFDMAIKLIEGLRSKYHLKYDVAPVKSEEHEKLVKSKEHVKPQNYIEKIYQCEAERILRELPQNKKSAKNCDPELIEISQKIAIDLLKKAHDKSPAIQEAIRNAASKLCHIPPPEPLEILAILKKVKLSRTARFARHKLQKRMHREVVCNYLAKQSDSLFTQIQADFSGKSQEQIAEFLSAKNLGNTNPADFTAHKIIEYLEALKTQWEVEGSVYVLAKINVPHNQERIRLISMAITNIKQAGKTLSSVNDQISQCKKQLESLNEKNEKKASLSANTEETVKNMDILLSQVLAQQILSTQPAKELPLPPLPNEENKEQKQAVEPQPPTDSPQSAEVAAPISIDIEPSLKAPPTEKPLPPPAPSLDSKNYTTLQNKQEPMPSSVKGNTTLLNQIFGLQAPSDRRLGQLIALQPDRLVKEQIEALNDYIGWKNNPTQPPTAVQQNKILADIKEIKKELSIVTNNVVLEQILEIKNAIDDAANNPRLREELKNALDQFEKTLGLIILPQKPQAILLKAQEFILDARNSIIEQAKARTIQNNAADNIPPPPLSEMDRMILAKIELRQALLEKREADAKIIEIKNSQENPRDTEYEKLKSSYELILPSIIKTIDREFIALITEQAKYLRELHEKYPHDQEIQRKLKDTWISIDQEVDKRKNSSSEDEMKKIEGLLTVPPPPAKRNAPALEQPKNDETQKKEQREKEIALAMLELREGLIEQKMVSHTVRIEDSDIDQDKLLSNQTKNNYKELNKKYGESRRENFDLAEYSKKVGIYKIGKKDNIEDPIGTSAEQKELVKKILGDTGYKILNPNDSKEAAPAPKTARMLYLQYLQTALDKQNKQNQSDKPIPLEKLLGKTGIKLYQAALQEEINDPAFINAVFLSAVENFRGPKWAKKLVLWIAGPSSSGKTYATKGMIERIAKHVMKKKEAEGDNYVVTIDGAIQREVSQMRKLTVDVAIELGYCGVAGVDKGIKDKLKDKIQKAAETKDDLSIATPDTLIKYVGDVIKDKLTNILPLKNLFESHAKNDNTLHIYSRIKSRKGSSAKKTFSLWVERKGNARAFIKIGKNHYSITIDGKVIIESKKYEKGKVGENFQGGITLASAGKKAYREIQKEHGKETYDFDVFNDQTFITWDKNKWRECTSDDNGNMRPITVRAFNAWLQYQEEDPGLSGEDQYKQLDTWLADKNGGNKPTLTEPMIDFYLDGVKIDYATDNLLSELQKLKEDAEKLGLKGNESYENICNFISMIETSKSKDPINVWKDHESDINKAKNELSNYLDLALGNKMENIEEWLNPENKTPTKEFSVDLIKIGEYIAYLASEKIPADLDATRKKQLQDIITELRNVPKTGKEQDLYIRTCIDKIASLGVPDTKEFNQIHLAYAAAKVRDAYNKMLDKEQVTKLIDGRNIEKDTASDLCSYLEALKNKWKLEDLVIGGHKQEDKGYNNNRLAILKNAIETLQAAPTPTLQSIQQIAEKVKTDLGTIPTSPDITLTGGTQKAVESLTMITTKFIDSVTAAINTREGFTKAIGNMKNALVKTPNGSSLKGEIVTNMKSYLETIQSEWKLSEKTGDLNDAQKPYNQKRLKALEETIAKLTAADITLQQAHTELHNLQTTLKTSTLAADKELLDKTSQVCTQLNKMQTDCVGPALYKTWLSTTPEPGKPQLENYSVELLHLGQYIASLIEHENKTSPTDNTSIINTLRNATNYTGKDTVTQQKFIYDTLVTLKDNDRFSLLVQHAQTVKRNIQAQIDIEKPEVIKKTAEENKKAPNKHIADKVATYLESIKDEWAAQELIAGVSTKNGNYQKIQIAINESIVKLKKTDPSPDLPSIKTTLEGLENKLNNISSQPAGLAYTLGSRFNPNARKKSEALISQVKQDISSITGIRNNYITPFIDALDQDEKDKNAQQAYEEKIRKTEARRIFVKGEVERKGESKPLGGTTAMLQLIIGEVASQNTFLLRELKNHTVVADAIKHQEKNTAEEYKMDGWKSVKTGEIKEFTQSKKPSLDANTIECRGLPSGTCIEYKNNNNATTIRESNQESHVQISVPKEPDKYNEMGKEEKLKVDIDIAEAMVRLWVARCGTPVPISDNPNESRMRALILVCMAHDLHFQVPLSSNLNYDFLNPPPIPGRPHLLDNEALKLKKEIGDGKIKPITVLRKSQGIDKLETEFNKLKEHYESKLKDKSITLPEEKQRCADEIAALGKLVTDAKAGKLSATAANDAIIKLSNSLKEIEIGPEPTPQSPLRVRGG